jgi:hypothetical protein
MRINLLKKTISNSFSVSDGIGRSKLPTVHEYIHNASKDLTLKLYLSYILNHRSIVNIKRFWDQFQGQQKNKLKEAVMKIDLPGVDENLIDLIYFIISNLVSAKSGSNTRTAHEYAFENYARVSGSKELRCENCGHFFSEKDLSQKSLQLVDQYNLKLSEHSNALRRMDRYKPRYQGSDKTRFTNLEIDHSIPNSLLGGGLSGENIQIFCRYCNYGKQESIFGLENVSKVCYTQHSCNNADDYTSNFCYLFYSTIFIYESKCSVTGKNSHETELTIRRKTLTDQKSPLLIPSEFESVSYEILRDEDFN